MDHTVLPLPMLILCLGAPTVYVVGRFVSRKNQLLASLTAICYLLSLLALLMLPEHQSEAQSALMLDPGAMIISIINLSLGACVAVYSGRYLALDRRYEDYYPLVLLLSAGLMGMVMAVDLFLLYLLTVLTSAAAYVLVAFRRRTATAVEAGLKYLIMGSMASMVALCGIGFLLRDSRSLLLPFESPLSTIWGAIGASFLLFAYLVKAAIVPAHTWLPDAHGRAPSSVSALLSGIIVQAFLYVLIKVGLGVGVPASPFGWLLVALSAATILVGSLMALTQVYGKRLLAYSSITQQGYIMLALGIGLAHGRSGPIAAAFFLLTAHAAMKALAFLCKGVLHFYCDATLVEELDGLFYRLPIPSTCFALALVGLAGVAPLAGFYAKLDAVVSLLEVASWGGYLAIVLLLASSLLSLGYYMPLIGRLLRPRTDREGTIHVSGWMLLPITVLTLGVLLMGFMRRPLLMLAESAATFLLTWRQ